MLRSRLGYVVALIVAAVLLAPAPAHAADPPRIDRLTGRVLHTADGDTIAIPVPKGRQNTLELLGTVRGGWLVAYHWKSRLLIVSPQGDVVRRIPYWKYEEYPGNADVVLSGDGTRVAILAIDRGDQSPAVVLDLQGRKVAQHRFTTYPTVLAKRGRTFYLSLGRGLLAWKPGVSLRRVTTADVRAVSLANGQIARDTEDGWGIATLRHPDHLRWTIDRRLFSTDFSPDGRRIAGEVRQRVEALSADDGSVVATWRFPGPARPVAKVWEDSRHLLVELTRDDDQHTLVRCSVGGGCERAVPWQAHPLLYWDYTKTR